MKKILLLLACVICLSGKCYADGWASNGLGGLYYIASASPTETENEVQGLFDTYSLDITNFRSQFYIFNGTDNEIWDYLNGSNGAFMFKKRLYSGSAGISDISGLQGAIDEKQDLITPSAHISDGATNAATNAPTDYNVITTLLGTLTSEVNSANARYNDLATKYNDLAAKVNMKFAHLEAQGLQESE